MKSENEQLLRVNCQYTDHHNICVVNETVSSLEILRCVALVTYKRTVLDFPPMRNSHVCGWKRKIMTDHDTFRAHHKLLTRSKRHTHLLTVQYTSLYIGQNKHTDTFLRQMVQATNVINKTLKFTPRGNWPKATNERTTATIASDFWRW